MRSRILITHSCACLPRAHRSRSCVLQELALAWSLRTGGGSRAFGIWHHDYIGFPVRAVHKVRRCHCTCMLQRKLRTRQRARTVISNACSRREHAFTLCSLARAARHDACSARVPLVACAWHSARAHSAKSAFPRLGLMSAPNKKKSPRRCDGVDLGAQRASTGSTPTL